jgi:Baculovirus F protein
MNTSLKFLLTLASVAAGYELSTLTNSTAVYEPLTTLLPVVSEWRLWTHVDLREFYTEYKTIQTAVDDFERLCALGSPGKVSENCQSRTEILKVRKGEILTINTYLKSALMTSKSRKRRALIGVVGQLSRQLFGTLTEDDAKFFDEQILKLERNEVNMSSTINQQISFLNNLYKLNNDSGNSVTSQIRTFQKKIARFDGDLNQIAVHGNETAIAERLNELFIMGVYSISAYHARQEMLYSILIDPGHSLSPTLINPVYLMKELKAVISKLPPGLALPFEVNPSNVFKFYHIFSVQVATRNERIVFDIRVPLVATETFDLYKITAVPRHVDGDSYAVAELEGEYLAMSSDMENFFLPTKHDLAKCQRLEKLLLCKSGEKTHKTAEGFCVIQLLGPHGKTGVCREKFVKIYNELWVPLVKSNTWLYVAPKSTRLVIHCKTTAVNYLRGVGTLELDDDCFARTDRTTLTAYRSIEETSNLTFSVLLEKFNLTENLKAALVHLPDQPETHLSLEEITKNGLTLPELTEISLLHTERFKFRTTLWALGSLASILAIGCAVLCLLQRFYMLTKGKDQPLQIEMDWGLTHLPPPPPPSPICDKPIFQPHPIFSKPSGY